MTPLHPAFVLLATAILAMLVRGRGRQLLLLLGSGLALWAQNRLTPEVGWTVAFPHYTLQILHVDALSLVFGLIFTMITAIGVLYALHRHRGGEAVATLMYAGAALGVVFAGDWITLFVFWELMAVASLFVVWYGGTSRSWAAGFRYLLVHVTGGSLLLCGILLYLANGGDLTLRALTTQAAAPQAAFWLILAGIAVNAAVVPLHAWLTDAYPEASVTGSVFLSAFTTKTAVYVLIRLFPGAEILVWAGVLMTLYGVLYAILEKDIRRLLSYHIVSQVGYMVAGVGMGTALALNGAAAHAFCHILYKALLFMGAGAVIQATGKRKLSELGGIGSQMWAVVVLYMIAAFSISGVPLFNGFISKSMVISAAAEAHRPVTELLLTLASVGTFLSVGLKLPYFAFFGDNRDGLTPRPLPGNMLLAMGIGAFLCIAIGIFPGWLYARLPFGADYHPYTLDHVVSSVQLLLATGVGFWLLLGKLAGEARITLDTDWLYRKPLVPALNALIALARQTGTALEQARVALLRALIPFVQNPFLLVLKIGLLPRTLSDSPIYRRRQLGPYPVAYDENRYRLPIGATVFWVVVFFASLALYTM